MPDKTYLIRFKEPNVVSLRVIAATAELHGEHLAFLRADGRLAALVLAEIVEEWFAALAETPCGYSDSKNVCDVKL
jgi:hypothetical protein